MFTHVEMYVHIMHLFVLYDYVQCCEDNAGALYKLDLLLLLSLDTWF